MVKIKDTSTPKTPKIKKKVSIVADNTTPFKSKTIERQKTPKIRKALELSVGQDVKSKKKLDLNSTPVQNILTNVSKTPKSAKKPKLNFSPSDNVAARVSKTPKSGKKLSLTPVASENGSEKVSKTPKKLNLTPNENVMVKVAKTPKSGKKLGLTPVTSDNGSGNLVKLPKSAKKLNLTATPIANVAKTPKSAKKLNLTTTPSLNGSKTPKSAKKLNLTATPSQNGVTKVGKTPKSGKKLDLNLISNTSIVANLVTTPKSKDLALKLPKTPKSGKKLAKKIVTQNDDEFDFSKYEEKYSIKSTDVEKAIKGVIQFASENPKLQNQLFSERIPLFLQVSCFKIHKGHSKILRLPLKNSLLTPDDDICFIVADVKGFKNKEHDKHLEHYEELFDKKGVKNIKKIMTFHEFRTEYETFELRSRLVDLYDYFLADSKICGKVVKKCGKIFYKKRKVPNPIKLQVTKLKEHIDKSLQKTQFNLTGNGDSYSIQFGHSKMETTDLIENVYSLLEGLDKEFPGGFSNIRNIQVFTHRATSIPIYVNMENPNTVPVPKLKSKKVKGPQTFSGELTTLPDAHVTVKRDGSIVVQRTGAQEDDPHKVTLEDIIKDMKNDKPVKQNKDKPEGNKKKPKDNKKISLENKKLKKQKALKQPNKIGNKKQLNGFVNKKNKSNGMKDVPKKKKMLKK